ncbi:MAG: hypothetical protein HXM21_00090 [Haemophilus influenzae]|nr:hypothetical protein [Haemophilus influenzae]
MIEINVPDYNDSLLEVELDEETFFLHFSWNETGEFWTLGIENAYNNELVSSLKILPERPLLQFVRNEHLPLGDLIAIRSDNGQVIRRDDFKNGKATLFYMSIGDEF